MILVVGATGTTGRAVVADLLERGLPVRALSRSPERAAELEALGAEPAVGDLADPSTLARPMRGVERLYVAVPASADQPRLEANAYAVAEQSGAYAVVKLGVLGQAPDAPVRFGRTHAEAFAALQASSLRWTLLQPAGFQQNFLRAPAVASARGDARVAHVDARDVAAVAARALAEEGHEACSYVLTGPDALTDEEVAEALGVPYREVSPEEVRALRVEAGVPEWNAEGLGELDDLYRSGVASTPAPDVEAVLGRPARSMSAVAG